MKRIIDLKDGDRIIGQFLVAQVSKGVTSNSLAYLNVTLQDCTGTIECKKWSYDDSDLDTFVAGNIVNVDGDVITYRDALQMKILSGSKLSFDHIDFSRFVKSAPIEKAELKRMVDGYIASIVNDDIKTLVEALIKNHEEDYFDWPAAVRNHHNFVSGLAYHSVCMARLAEKTCECYPSLDRDILVGAALIHDLGKIEELSGPVATKYTLEGNLIGHISIMQAEIRNTAEMLGIDGEIPTLLQHMIVSHHGIPEYGSPIVPLTREALALSMIDDLDAKMAVLDNAFAGVEPGCWSEKIFAMDGKKYYLTEYNHKK